GYRAVLAEAGHLCQNVCLTATWLGLAPFCTMALADSVIERDLGVDGVTESVVYAAGIGTRPRGVSWAPWPEPHPVRRIPGPIGRAVLDERRCLRPLDVGDRRRFRVDRRIVPGCRLQILTRERVDVGVHVVRHPVRDAGADGNRLEASGVVRREKRGNVAA